MNKVHVTALTLFWSGLLAAGLYIQATFDIKKGYYTTMYSLVTLVSGRYGYSLIMYYCRSVIGSSSARREEKGDALEEIPASIANKTKDVEEKTKTDPDDPTEIQNTNDDLEEQPNNASTNTKEAVVINTSTTGRVYYMSNLKSFMVFCVVLGHTACAFGVCGPRWQLAVGIYINNFFNVGVSLAVFFQGFIMPLFFFISAYFTAGSYEKKGGERFFVDKGTRLLLPAIFCFLVIVPLTKMLSQYVGGVEINYMPNAGPEWFVFWLLVLDWAYSTFYEATAASQPPTEERRMRPFPGTLLRVSGGVFFCGLVSFLVLFMLRETSGNLAFAGMPISIGSLPCNVFLYGTGIYARRNRWLEDTPIRQRLDIPVWLLRLFVLAEYAAMVAFAHKLINDPNGDNSNIYRVMYFLIAGLFCVDAGLVVLEFFQHNMNFENSFTRFLSDSAYMVYLTHVFVVVSYTAIFVVIYNAWAESPLVFYTQPGGFTFSPTVLEGGKDGAVALGVGFLVTFTLSQLTAWPLAWALRQIPGVKKFI